MRTHIRMHFDKKSTELNEEHYMSCIMEDDGLELPSAVAVTADQIAHQMAVAQQKQQQKQQQQQQQQIAPATTAPAPVAASVVPTSGAPLLQPQQQQQVFNCDVCNYTSNYKGNVVSLFLIRL